MVSRVNVFSSISGGRCDVSLLSWLYIFKVNIAFHLPYILYGHGLRAILLFSLLAFDSQYFATCKNFWLTKVLSALEGSSGSDPFCTVCIDPR